jgi:alpha-beta hydrolase superfamily lysophospholipase
MWAPALASGYRTVAADSSQRVTSDRATWADLDRAIADVTSQVEDHPAPVIIGGRSLGAAVALHLANTGTVTAAGVVLVAPTIRWDLVEPARPSPTVILAGENDTDRLRAAALDVADFLRQARSPVDYQLVPGMGHFYPDDFAELLVEALKWIENQGTG